MADDPFAGMSHEEMLDWLDQANPAVVRAGADKLLAAAKEIEKIAAELKTRPQYVEWKGQGADAFRAWAGDLANATLRLADYSADNGTFLSHTADAIARAKASIPRDDGGAQANIDAARAAPHDPDAAKVLAGATARKEAVRQQAADEMNKLGQAYQQSAERMTSKKPPTIPPPPDAIVPMGEKSVEDFNYVGSSGGTGGAASGTGSAGAPTGHAVAPSAGQPEGQSSLPRAPHADAAVRPAADAERPISMDIDSTATLPETPRLPSGPTTGTPPAQGPASTGALPPAVPLPPVTTGPAGRTGIGTGPRLPAGPSMPAGQGRAADAGRPLGPTAGRAVSATPGSSEGRTAPVAGRPSASMPYGRAPGASPGIYGGRPSQQRTGRAAPNRGTVVGGENQGGTTSGGRTAGQCPPTPSRGVMGGPPDRRAARTATGERAVPGSAAVSRDGIVGGSAAPRRGGRADGAPTPSSPRSRQDERGGERSGPVRQDEAT